MAALTNYLEDQLGNWLFNNETFDSSPTSLWLALHTDHPVDGTENEVTSADYDRVETGLFDWETSGNQPLTALLESDAVFDQAQSNWGTIRYVTIWDGPSTGDNPLIMGPVEIERTINDGDQYSIMENEGTVTIN